MLPKAAAAGVDSPAGGTYDFTVQSDPRLDGARELDSGSPQVEVTSGTFTSTASPTFTVTSTYTATPTATPAGPLPTVGGPTATPRATATDTPGGPPTPTRTPTPLVVLPGEDLAGRLMEAPAGSTVLVASDTRALARGTVVTSAFD